VSLSPTTLALRQQLLPEPGQSLYCILDGASVDGLLDKLFQLDPAHVCLYRGKLEPDLAETAPYLVQLDLGSEFATWVIEDGWGKHWGIFAHSEADLEAVRRHFRRFLMVRGPDGKQLYFRYYDPRVLRVFLPTCDEEQTQTLFGPIETYLLEADEADRVVRFRRADGVVREEVAALPQR